MKVELLLIADDSKRIKDFSSLSYLIAVDSDVELTERSNKKYKFKYRRSSEIEIKMSKNKNILNENVFHLEIEGSYEALGSFRGLLLSIVKPYFDEIYIISDEVSMEMCRKAYPLINEIENLMRKFIVNFMILKVGSDWWTLNTKDTLINKAEDRKSKVTPYRELISQDIFHIDFKDLIVFLKGFSGFKTKEDVIQKLMQCENLEQYEKLKQEALSNWEKFFNSLFSNEFLKDWESLADYRNQVAHNKLLGGDALNKISLLHGKLKNTLVNAIGKINSFKYSEQEIEAINNKINEGKNLILKADIEILKNDYSLEIADIVEFIETYKINGKIKFSTFSLIYELTNKYRINEPINRVIGRILGEMKANLSITKTNEIEKVKDDEGNPTNSTIWEIIV